MNLSKIIVVDDDEDTLAIVKYCLRDLANTEVKCLNSGEKAIQEALTFKPDLILLDIMMPKMDGMSTLKAIQLIPSIAHTPIIFFTAKVQASEIEEYFKYGVIDVLVKPFDPLSLAENVRKIWDKYQSKS